LLWRSKPESTRGPKPGLSVDQIVLAAIDVADADGLAAVTMRRVAEHLKVGTMSLYTYIPGKAELLDVMLDQVYGEVSIPDDAMTGWRNRVEHHAREDWNLYQRHPWVLQVDDARALLGPNELRLYESAFQAVSGFGLTGREMVAVVSLFASYVRGAAQVAVEEARAAEKTGVTDAQWWSARAPILDEYFDPSRYPTLASIDTDGAFDPVEGGEEYNLQFALDTFEFGLQRMLDGIEAFVLQRAAEIATA